MQLRRETVGSHSLLYTWQGSDTSLNPILLIGHLDVVPVEASTERDWLHDPFGGGIADGFIWGRGAIDNKSAVLGTLEAVEMLLAEGFQPARTVYLAYGHDEEVGGAAGAGEIAALLKARGVELQMVLDEGGMIGNGILSGISAPVALVGIAEKGFATIEVSTRVPGGHSSLPARQSAIGILSAAVARVEQSPMAARLEGPTRELFDRIGPQLPTMQRAIFANLWLTAPLVLRRLEASPTTNAMVRTTRHRRSFTRERKTTCSPATRERSSTSGSCRATPWRRSASTSGVPSTTAAWKSRMSGVSLRSRLRYPALIPKPFVRWSGPSEALSLMRS
jgi:carboxypeptidase PM20D1